MPSPDDTRTLVPIAAADLTSEDLIQVFDASSNSARKIVANTLGSGTTESVLALLQTAILEAQRLTLGKDDEDSANSMTIRRFRAADGTELPKTRIVTDRGASGDPVNQDYLAWLVTHNLDWETGTRDDTSLVASRFGVEYNYNDEVMEFNWDVISPAGTTLPRVFHMVQPNNGTMGTFSINLDCEFHSLRLIGENGDGFALDATSRIRSRGASPGDVFWTHVENTHTTHSACGFLTKGTISGVTRGWSFALDRLQSGSADGFITDETYAGETLVVAFRQSTKNVDVLVGDLEVSTTGKGVIMKSPNGSRWRLTVSNAGVVSATAL